MSEELLEQGHSIFSREYVGTCLSMGLLTLFVAAHFWRSDTLHLATLVPMFCWLAIGLALSALTSTGALRLTLICLWLGCVIAVADSPGSLIRRPRSAHNHGRSIRVVSMNCLGRPAALQELAALDADIFLLQEAPAPRHLTQFVESELAGEATALFGSDTALIVKGTAHQLTEPHRSRGRTQSNFIGAEAMLTDGTKLIVVSLRLLPTPIRWDVLNPACWRFYATNHAERRADMQKLATFLASRTDLPHIVGGDFNTPAGDSIFQELPTESVDTFHAAGSGWGKTIPSAIPLHRIDQIWCSNLLTPTSCRAIRSKASDHRAVACDLLMKQQLP